MLVAGNWKMHGNGAEARARAKAIAAWFSQHRIAIDVVLFPPALHLPLVLDAVRGADIGVGAQDVHSEPAGAFTGDVSSEMVAELGARYAIVGHSERRQHTGDTDVIVAAKAVAVLRAGLTPVLCVGESLAERQGGSAERVIRAQLSAVVERVGEQIERCILAYEPVWAIGTGENASPSLVAEMHGRLRGWLQQSCRDAAAVRILYGGSINAANARALFAVPDVDGGLVGGASLIAEQFLAICTAAEEAR